MSSGTLRISRMDGGGGDRTPLLQQFAAEIYDRAFHDKHREPSEAWLQRLGSGSHDPQQHAALALDGDMVLGGCLSEDYGEDITLLTYIVVRPSYRGQGVGSALMREALQHHAGRTVFAEVADPDRSEDRAEALRRLRFFLPWGWRAVGSAYFQPPLEPGGRWAEDLILLHRSRGQGDIPAERVRSLTCALRRSLDAGPEPEGLRHRYKAVATDRIPTFDLRSLQEEHAA